MKKIKITESQFKTIIESSINEARKSELLEEGLKELLLGAAMMLGVGMNAQNTQAAKDALDNEQVIAQLSDAIENDSTRNKLVTAMTNIGVNDAESKLIDANSKVLNKLKKGEKLGDVQTLKGTKSQINAKLKNGNYGLVDIEADTVFIKSVDVIKINFEFELSSDNAFKTGSFELSNEINKKLLELQDSLQYFNTDDVKITIESSTDTEPIRKFISKEDTTGNNKLAQLRANAVYGVISSFGIADSNIKVITLGDQGPNIFTNDMSNEARDSARKETSEYRYVKVSVEIVNNLEVSEEEKIAEIKYTCKFVQTYKEGGKTQSKKGKSKIKVSFINKDGEAKDSGLVCPAF